MAKIPFKSLITAPYRAYHRFVWRIKFANFGKKSWIVSPLRIEGFSNIFVGDKVSIHYKTWLSALPLTGQEEVRLEIGDGAVIGDFNHIFATRGIIIEKYVLTANHVYISDNLHDYRDINLPIIGQPILQQKIVKIGEGSWLGENVCVIGSSIGKHCVIGANSVVTHDIPDYSVAVGSPAYIIKRYNFKTKQWKKTDKQGNFLEQ